MNLPAARQLEQAIEAIDGREPEIRAFAFLAIEDARKQAAALDALPESAKRRLPLFGVPVAIKDVIDVAAMPTQAGSRILKDFLPRHDADCVRRLRNAGAIIIGKTATSEFAFLDPAETRNPRNTGHTPGGSSSGSAAAVAAGFCSAALGTQTFGSVIRPAAYCGVIGLKPTYGAISKKGVIPVSWTLDHVGIFARTVHVASQLAEVLFDVTFPVQDSESPQSESRSELRERVGSVIVGLPDRYFTSDLAPEVQTAYGSALEHLRMAGASTEVVTLPSLFESALAAAEIILRVEAAAFHRRWYPESANEYGPKLRALLESGNRISGMEYVKALQIRQEARRQMRELWTRMDFLATPATPCTAPEGIASTGNPVFNTPFSVFGNPAMNLPVHFSRQGLPTGLQLVARTWQDRRLLRLAQLLEGGGLGLAGGR